MSKILILLLTSLSINSAIAKEKKDKHQEPAITETINGTHVYGEKWQALETKVEIKKALASAKDYIGQQMVFSGNISKVCQKSGCWMILEQSGEFARVDFNNHAFFIPKDSQGQAEVLGKLKLKEMTEQQKKHLEDEGAGSLPKKVYEITATSVKIHS